MAVMPPDGVENRLVAQAIGGDADAFAQLYEMHLERVYRHLYYRVGNSSDAEDLAQQTFLQAWRALPRYRPGGSPFIAWLLTIAHHLAVSFYRKPRAQSYLTTEGDLPASRSDPEVETAARLQRDGVRRVLLRLKADYQQVLLLRFLEGLPVREVAAVLKRTEGATRVLQHRALQALRRLLEREEVQL